MNAFDASLFFPLYHLSGLSNWSDQLIIFLGDYYIYATLLVFGYYLYRDYRSHLKLYMLALVAAFFARYGVASFIRIFIHRPRPFLALSLPHLINDATYSFPSGHTIFMFALATAVLFFNKKLAYFLYISGLVIGLARVAGGVHYPSDIAGAIILGSATGVVLYALCKWLYPQAVKIN